MLRVHCCMSRGIAKDMLNEVKLQDMSHKIDYVHVFSRFQTKKLKIYGTFRSKFCDRKNYLHEFSFVFVF